VQAQHTVIKRGGLYWDREALPPAVFEHRLRQVQAAIAGAGDDAWLLVGDSHRYGNLAYMCHFLPRARSAVVLVPREGQPTLLASVGLRDIPALKTLTPIDDIRPFLQLPREAIRLLTEKGLGQAKIGLAGVREGLSYADWAAISSELPEVQWRQRDDELGRLRAAKAEAERAVIRKAMDVVQAGLDAAPSALRPGETVRSALATVDKAIRYAGAEDVRLLIAVGNGELRPAHDGVLKAGQPVSIMAAAEVQRYWAEAAATYPLGTTEPTAVERAIAALEAMVSAARPGAAAGALAAAARAALTAQEWRHAERYGLGSGIGLDLEEPPCIRSDERAQLVKDAALALHVVLPGAIAGRTLMVA
jgi:Xaa-Pro dipeptidase